MLRIKRRIRKVEAVVRKRGASGELGGHGVQVRFQEVALLERKGRCVWVGRVFTNRGFRRLGVCSGRHFSQNSSHFSLPFNSLAFRNGFTGECDLEWSRKLGVTQRYPKLRR